MFAAHVISRAHTLVPSETSDRDEEEMDERSSVAALSAQFVRPVGERDQKRIRALMSLLSSLSPQVRFVFAELFAYGRLRPSCEHPSPIGGADALEVLRTATSSDAALRIHERLNVPAMYWTCGPIRRDYGIDHELERVRYCYAHLCFVADLASGLDEPGAGDIFDVLAADLFPLDGWMRRPEVRAHLMACALAAGDVSR